MLDVNFIKNWKDKEVSDVVLEYLDFGTHDLQQCIDEVTDVKNYLKGRKFSTFLEIGSDTGGSLFIFSKLFCCQKAKIISIDPRRNKYLDLVIDKLLSEGFDVEYLNGKSQDYAGKLTCDLLHIDGDHLRPADDFSLYYPFVNSGGVVLVHDTMNDVLVAPQGSATKACGRMLEREYNGKTFVGKHLVSKNYDYPTGITLVEKK